MADRKSRESSWKYGLSSVIAVVVVMVAVGFAVGVISGITWEEPALVVGYLSGQTEEVDWGVGAEDPEAGDLAADAAIPKPPSVAAAPPLGQREMPDAAVPKSPRIGADVGVASTRKVAPKTAPTSTQPKAGFSVQVGAFSEKSAARALADSLREHGYPVYLSPTEGDPTNWRVRVGPLSTRPEAEKAAHRLETAEKLPTWVLGEDS